MSVRVEMVTIDGDGIEQRREVLTIERQELAMETLGMTLTEGKALLAGVQEFVIAQQVYDYLERHRACSRCGRPYTSKDSGRTSISTVFGQVDVPNPRWNRCSCQAEGPKTFRPMRTWLNGQTSPEMLYLETKWASLIPFARVAGLLKDVLPVEDSMNRQTVRNHLYATAERSEQELGDERQPDFLTLSYIGRYTAPAEGACSSQAPGSSVALGRVKAQATLRLPQPRLLTSSACASPRMLAASSTTASDTGPANGFRRPSSSPR